MRVTESMKRTGWQYDAKTGRWNAPIEVTARESHRVRLIGSVEQASKARLAEAYQGLGLTKEESSAAVGIERSLTENKVGETTQRRLEFVFQAICKLSPEEARLAANPKQKHQNRGEKKNDNDLRGVSSERKAARRG